MGNKPIVHAPIATGSTEPRDIRDRFADFVNLKDFGAKGDGITDDSSAWVAWQTALQNGGMPYIPEGDYLLGEEIVHAPKGHFGRNSHIFTYEDDGAVIDEFSAPIYVDASVTSSGDGLTIATAVKTINEALNIASETFGRISTIVIASGTYTENIDINLHSSINLFLAGNVTLNGKLSISDGSYVHLGNYDISTDYTLSISNNDVCIGTYDSSTVFCAVKLNLTGLNGATWTIIASGKSSSVFLLNTTTVSTQSNISNLLVCYSNSFIYIGGSFSNTVASNTYVNSAISATDGSCWYIAPPESASITVSITAQICFYALYGSYGKIEGDIECTLTSTDYHCICAERHSAISISNIGNSNFIKFQTNGTTIPSFINLNINCAISIYDSNCIFNGKVEWGTVSVDNLSHLYFPSSNSVSGSVTGKRYDISRFSIVRVAGQGENRFPGTSNGTIVSYGFYY